MPKTLRPFALGLGDKARWISGEQFQPLAIVEQKETPTGDQPEAGVPWHGNAPRDADRDRSRRTAACRRPDGPQMLITIAGVAETPDRPRIGNSDSGLPGTGLPSVEGDRVSSRPIARPVCQSATIFSVVAARRGRRSGKASSKHAQAAVIAPCRFRSCRAAVIVVAKDRTLDRLVSGLLEFERKRVSRSAIKGLRGR